MMEFKKCKFYENAIKQEHCPFECVCTDDCYFTRMPQDIEKHIEEYEEYIDKCREVNELRDTHYNLREEIRALEIGNEILTDVIINILKKEKVKNVDKYIDGLDDITQRYIKIRL